MRDRVVAAKTALALTAAVAAVLVAMALLDAPWLGWLMAILLLAAFGAREIAVAGRRGATWSTLVLLAVIAVAFVVSRLAGD